jgi:molybdopterin synthase catalytic subunit
MIVLVAIVDGPLTQSAEAAARSHIHDELTRATRGGCIGASLRFEGIVRRLEDGRELIALEYRTYDPMAERELHSLARAVAERHGLSSIIALHSRGRVPVGEASFVLEVAAPHRREALAAVTDFIDRLKQDVPIWKQPVWA